MAELPAGNSAPSCSGQPASGPCRRDVEQKVGIPFDHFAVGATAATPHQSYGFLFSVPRTGPDGRGRASY